MAEIEYITLVNNSGANIVLSPLGAGIVAINVPDREGHLADVVLGYPRPEDYMADGPCAGKIPGRYANRISLARFSIDGKEYRLTANVEPNALHGGPTGFQNRVWDVVEKDENHVVFRYVSADGEEGYPGNLTVTATYTWSEDNVLSILLEAQTDAPTVVNLTNHAYFNLAGHNSGSVLSHNLTLRATRYLPTDSSQIPTGELAPVAGTPMDFTTAKTLGADIHADFEALKIGKGYDHCWVVDDYVPGKEREVAVLEDPQSGRVLTVFSNQPGMQIYTGNWLTGCPAGKDGVVYHDYDAVAIECQDFPDAPNKPQFPSTVLKPGDTYKRVIRFAFSTK